MAEKGLKAGPMFHGASALAAATRLLPSKVRTAFLYVSSRVGMELTFLFRRNLIKEGRNT